MGTAADKLNLLQATKADLKAALTEKGQTPGDVFSEYPDMVRAIETGTQLPELTSPGVAADLRQGKQLIDQEGNVVDGTLVEVEQATPSISVSSAGLITASAAQSGGIVAEGSKSATKQLTTQDEKIVTPGTSDQTAVASGRYTTGAVTVKGDANLVPANIKSGVSIFGVTGTASAYGYASISDDTVTFTKIKGHTTFRIAAPGATASSKLRCISALFAFEGINDSIGLRMDVLSGYAFEPTGSGSEMGAEVTLGDGVVLITLTDSDDTLYDDLSDAGLQNPTSWYRVKGGVCFENT